MASIGSDEHTRPTPVRRYLVAAALALPAGTLVGLALGASFALGGNPDWRADTTASETWRFVLGFAWLGLAVGAAAAVGAVAGVLITAGRSRRERIVYAGLGASFAEPRTSDPRYG